MLGCSIVVHNSASVLQPDNNYVIYINVLCISVATWHCNLCRWRLIVVFNMKGELSSCAKGHYCKAISLMFTGGFLRLEWPQETGIVTIA